MKILSMSSTLEVEFAGEDGRGECSGRENKKEEILTECSEEYRDVIW